jgi:hypothetical protein
MHASNKSAIRLKKPLSQRIYLAGYMICMALGTPSLTYSTMFKRDTSSAGFLYILSLVFAIKVIRYVVTANCIKVYHREASLTPSTGALLWAFFKPSWVHFPMLGIAPILAGVAAGGNISYLLGVGTIGSCIALFAYLFAIDIPFRIKSDAKNFSS